ncbi:MAG: hypothetical protein ABR964_10345 [Tepidisphaeraceae bacterium]
MDSKRTLSEISHLFLSEMRQRQTGQRAAPPRVGPPKAQTHAAGSSAAGGGDIRSEAFAAAAESLETDAAQPGGAGHVAVSVVLGSHLADDPGQRMRQYARHLAAECGRVGLIEVDSGEFLLACFEAGGGEPTATATLEQLDGRKMSEALAEMSFDVGRWLICLPNPRSAESRQLLKMAPHWVLLTTAEHDGVVATYRALKGYSELGKPRVSLAVLGARHEAEAAAVFHKLDAVAGQFLGCRMQAEAAVRPVALVAEHVLLHCRAAKGQPTGAGPQWRILGDFLANAVVPDVDQGITEAAATMKWAEEMPAAPVPTAPLAATQGQEAMRSAVNLGGEEPIDEVIDLPDGSEESILTVIVSRGGAAGQWVQCPIKPPTCPQAVLAVGRDHRLVLVAVAGRGLSQLRRIGLAARWMNENRELIRMALPQLAIDAHLLPCVHLLVDQADVSAQQLGALLASQTVTVQAYRKVRWGQKRGLLLEAA